MRNMKFYLHYWKLGVHLVFKTQHFGVNNRWWVKEPSAIGWTFAQKLWGYATVIPLIRNYQSMRVRACIGWMPEADCIALGFAAKKH